MDDFSVLVFNTTIVDENNLLLLSTHFLTFCSHHPEIIQPMTLCRTGEFISDMPGGVQVPRKG